MAELCSNISPNIIVLNISPPLILYELSSDHYPLLTTIFGKASTNSTNYQSKHTNWNKFCDYINDKIHLIPQINDPITIDKIDSHLELLNNLLAAGKHHASKILPRLPLDYVLLPQNIRDLINSRNKLKRIFFRYKNPIDGLLLKDLNKVISKKIRDFKNSQWEKYLSTVSFNDQNNDLWRLSKNLTRTIPKCPPIQVNDTLIFDEQKKINLMTSTYNSFEANPEVNMKNILLPSLIDNNTIQTSPKEIVEIINNLNIKKAPGLSTRSATTRAPTTNQESASAPQRLQQVIIIIVNNTNAAVNDIDITSTITHIC
ncbi:hypothetical protein J437_LFUL003813 [Ladona fulva]|uniref:Uncharacterized protein n=1 Tax=Ladona fulva TaxID=123851 RepID=A0A8K0KK44_LADFU|nr:hypothetical protein J437_LFUL003813 [Ladona fulva]